MSIEGKGHFFTIYFKVLYLLCFTRPIYQASIYRTIGPLVFCLLFALKDGCSFRRVLGLDLENRHCKQKWQTVIFSWPFLIMAVIRL